MLMQADIQELLRAHSLFVAFDEDRFERLTTAAQVVYLEPGQLLFQRGDPARAFFIVVSGQIKLYMQSRAGDEKILALEPAGQSFAEAIMFMQGPMYPVSAAATEQTTLVSVPAREYRQALQEDINTCMRMLGVLSQRLHAHVQEIEELTLESAANRLIRNLLRRAEEDSMGRMRVHMEETRQMLASQLSIKPETLSRLTRSLSDAGLIELVGRDIFIPDLARLRSYGEG
jgi:CRP-like cAMP-binding protein